MNIFMLDILKQLIHPLTISFTLLKVTDSGTATAFLLTSTSLHLEYSLLFLSSIGLHFHPSLDLQNVKPRKLLSLGLTTLVLVAETLRNSFLSSHELIDFITLSADISLLTKMFTSSAKRTNLKPLASSSLSSLSRQMFDNTQLTGDPCGTPSSDGETRPSSIIPDLSIDLIR